MFNTKEVVAVANAIYRKNGYIKKSEVGYSDKVANVTMLYDHFFGEDKIKVEKCDIKTANKIVEYFRGLSFKALERQLTAFENNVLTFVMLEELPETKHDIGIAVSLPKVYENKLKQDRWTEREAELSRSSEYLGSLGKRGTFDAVVENVRWIGSTDSYLYCCSVNNKDILKFFTQKHLGNVGKNIRVAGIVKDQSVSEYHGGCETKINRIKITE